MSAQASGQLEVNRRVTVTEPFSGQLLDGVDVRGTLRECARGNDRLIVRDHRIAPRLEHRSVSDAFPVVWIFDTGRPCDGRMLSLRTPLPLLLQAAEDRAALERLREHPGEDMVELVFFTDDQGSESRLDSVGTMTRYKTRGWLLFRPQCPTLRQAADWVVQTRSRLRPTYSNGLGDELPGEIRRSLDRDGGPRLAELTWQDTLLRIALAFGGRTLTLVAPTGFTPAPAIRRYAAQRGQSIGRVPITVFPPGQVARIRSMELVPGRVEGQEGRIVYHGKPDDVFTAAGATSRANNAQANLLTARFELLGLPDAVELEPEILEVDAYYASENDWRRRKTLVLLARLREHAGDLDIALDLMEKSLRLTRKVPTQHRLADAAYGRRLRAVMDGEYGASIATSRIHSGRKRGLASRRASFRLE
jgi:hypothetical protein